MNQPETEDPIDALLREQNHHLDDAGFTARVIKSLPRRRRRRAWWRPAILLTATAAGSVLAGAWLPWESLARPVSASALLSNPQAGLAWGATLCIVAALACGVVSALEPFWKK